MKGVVNIQTIWLSDFVIQMGCFTLTLVNFEIVNAHTYIQNAFPPLSLLSVLN